MTLALLLPPVLSPSARLFCLFLLIGRATPPVTESTGSAEILRLDLSSLFSNLPEQSVFAEPFSPRVSNLKATPKPPSKPPDLQPRSRSMVHYHPRSSQLPFFSHPSPLLVPCLSHTTTVLSLDLSFPSIIFLSFGQSKVFVLLLAGEGTTESLISVFVILNILVRRCKIMGLAEPFHSVLIEYIPRGWRVMSRTCLAGELVSTNLTFALGCFSGGNSLIRAVDPSVLSYVGKPPRVYTDFAKNFLHWERLLSPSSFHGKGCLSSLCYLPDSMPVNLTISSIDLLFCVAPSFVSTKFEDEDWLLKSPSQVTTLRSLGTAVMVLLMQARLVSILLSSYLKDLYDLMLFAVMLCFNCLRGWVIPSSCCKMAV
uniref:Uncharacterized protein n=1 Tax=Noccaea caerulescens TaxID=107243 RepID=A0A1J3J395_NOCCA